MHQKELATVLSGQFTGGASFFYYLGGAASLA